MSSPLAGTSFSTFSVVGVTNNNTLSGVLSAGGQWPTATLDTGKYVGFNIQPAAGFQITLTSIEFKSAREDGPGGSDGPASLTIRSSLDGFTSIHQTSPTYTNPLNNTTPSAPASSPWDFTDIVLNPGGTAHFRFYAHAAANTNRFMLFDDIVLNGTVTSAAVSTLSLSASLPGGFSNVADSTNPNKPDGAGHEYVDVVGSSGKYVSEIDDLTSNVNKGSVAVNDVGGEGPTYVMLWLTGTGIDSLLTALEPDTAFDIAKFDVSNSDPLYADIQSLLVHYPGFTALAKFNTTSNNGFVNWDFAAHTGVVVDKVAVVPEPAALGLMALGGALALPRRRRGA